METKVKKLVSYLMIVAISFSILLPATNVEAAVKAPPNLGSYHAYSVIDARTGEILLSDNADDRVYPASTTKMMTATVILEKAKLSKKIKITNRMIKSAPRGCSVYGIRAGEVYTVETLLNMLLICSAGDAATALAIGVYGSVNKCVSAMNHKCNKLGLKGTSFDNTIGIDIGDKCYRTYTTANDMAVIARVAMSNKDIKKIVKRSKYTVRTASGKKGRTISSTNRFYSTVEYPKELYTVIGTKSGHTKAAGYVFAATAIDKSGREVICVYMGKDSYERTFKDIRTLLNTVYTAQQKGKIELSQGKQEINVKKNSYKVILGETKKIKLGVSVIDKHTGCKLGTNAGKITYSVDKKKVAAVDKKGLVTIKGKGQAFITIKVDKTLYHKVAVKKIKLIVEEPIEEDVE